MTLSRGTVERLDRGRRDFLATMAGWLVCTLRPTVRRSDGPSVQPSSRPLAQDTLPGAGPSGRLFAPQWAGRPQPPGTARDNDAAIQGIEKRLRCPCGCTLDVYTCRTTDFTCTVSPAMHREILALVDAGKDGQQIVEDFVARHGMAVLMAPPQRGFNLVGYFVPSLAILAGAVVLVAALRRWSRAARATSPGPRLDASADELARLQRELDRLPD